MIKYKKSRLVCIRNQQMFLYMTYSVKFIITLENKINLVRHYPHKLVRFIEVSLLSVQAVSEDNKRKVTAGINVVIKLSPEQRLDLIQKLILNDKASKIRRVFIPKLIVNFLHIVKLLIQKEFLKFFD